MHYRAISYINLPKKYDDASLVQFVVHHATDSNRTIRVECLRCHHTCQIFKCRFAVGQLSADSWPTVYGQTFRGAVLHFLREFHIRDVNIYLKIFRLLAPVSCEKHFFSPVYLAFCLTKNIKILGDDFL